MLIIKTEPFEMYDEVNNEFIQRSGGEVLLLEHSLISVSKWESKWHKPFLSTDNRTDEELEDYIGRCMRVTNDPKVDSSFILSRISETSKLEIQEYIKDPMSATKLPKDKITGPKSSVTSELIYYYMINFQIPFECEKWHLNRLLTLINVCNTKNQPKKKISPSEVARRNTELNAARRAELKTSG